MADHPLAKAAREVNAYADEHTTEETCQHYDLRAEDVAYVAEQRALRALYAAKGINLGLTQPAIINLSVEDRLQMIPLIAAYMDALVIGWRANQFRDTK
jgi:hypothetical protein